MQCALVLQHPQHAEQLGARLAKALQDLNPSAGIDVVASPAVGGLIIGHEVARALDARHVFAERDGSGKMTLRRGFQVQPGETAVVIEDVITTGGSSREVYELLRDAGVDVVAAGSIIDRSAGEVNVGIPRVALASMKVTAYSEAECPLCRDGIPVEKPGSRKS
jgi:orotate phosphoribosyltransferase